ncbi:MAG: DNA cytosine methyltransferase [Candidatus Cryosericum sp.]
MRSRAMQVADFFCGAGGFSEGFRQAGFDIVFGVDKWLPAVTTFRANKPGAKVIQADVIQISELLDDEFDQQVPDTEVIIGSPPCVAFSNSNKSGNGDKALGLQLLHAYLKIVARKKFKPTSKLKYWVLENVPNIQKYVKDRYTAAELGIPGLGEDAVLCPLGGSSGVYNAKYFGVPSSRRRFLCGEFPGPLQTCTDETVVPMQHVLNALGEPCQEDRSVIADSNYPDLVLPVQGVSDHQYKCIVQEFECKKLERLKQDKGYMGKMSFPENTTKPSRTIMATMSASSRESMILQSPDGKYRLPTVREAASMMSFPIDYRFYGATKGIKYTLVGNAVPPKLSFAIADAICNEVGLDKPRTYPRIVHDSRIDFVDLNYKVMPEKKEKSKRPDAKFKYHIPHLIIDRYRVELTNNSELASRSRRLRWGVELHYGQGKDKARRYAPHISAAEVSPGLSDQIEAFVKDITPQLCAARQFQQRYCMSAPDRRDLIGPYELLQRIREFIDASLSETERQRPVQIHDDPKHIPQAISAGYYILERLTKAIGGMGNGRDDKKAGVGENQGVTGKREDDWSSPEVQGR